MIAVPVFQSRVAPVLDWCTRVVLITPEQLIGERSEAVDWDPADPFQRLRALHDRGVTTVICGAVSRELLLFAESLGMEVIRGISGELAAVLEGYRTGRLQEASFRLPGCRGRVQHRLGPRCRQQHRETAGTAAEKPGFGPSRGRDSGTRVQDDSSWVCPKCRTLVRCEPGISSSASRCPNCGETMVRG